MWKAQIIKPIKFALSQRPFCTIGTSITSSHISSISNDNIQCYESIPGPTPLPLLGNTWRFLPFVGTFKIEHIDKVSVMLHRKYGKIVRISGLLGRPDMVFLFDPDDVEKVYRQEDHLPLRPSMPSLDYYKHVYRKSEFSEHPGVIAVHGKQWQEFRSKVNKILLQPKVAQLYINTLVDTAEEFSIRIGKLRNSTNEMPKTFLNELHKWSLESIAKVALNKRLGSLEDHPHPDTQRLIDAVQTFFISVPILELKMPFWRLWNTPTFNKYLHALDTIREITLHHVENALTHTNYNDNQLHQSILGKVLQAETNTKLASHLALDMFLVGIDTTSNALASIIYQLSLNQENQAKVHEEIAEILPHFSTPITYEKLEQLQYLKACIRETMRLYPVVIGNGRCTTDNCVIRNYHIPKGVQVIFQHYAISNMEEYFMDCKEFKPERWLVTNKDHHPFASLPFGYGKRMCLGRRIADLELLIALATILRKYRIEYNHKHLDYHIHPMYTPNGPLLLKFLEK